MATPTGATTARHAELITESQREELAGGSYRPKMTNTTMTTYGAKYGVMMDGCRGGDDRKGAWGKTFAVDCPAHP